MAGCNLRKGQDWDFNTAWGGGNWKDRFGKAEFGAGMEGLEGGAWADRTGLGGLSRDIIASMKEFNEAWGGGAWMDDRLGMAQFDKKASAGGETDEPTMPDDPGDGSSVTDDTMNDLTEGDPEEEARIAQQRAMRRRALQNKMGKRSTIRTGGRGATGY